MSELKALPTACTLAPGNLNTRLADVAALTRDALIDHERRDLVLELRYRLEAAERVRAMVDGEQHCCPFLTIDVTQDQAAVNVTVTAPERARDAAMELFAHFTDSTAASAR